MHAEGEGFVRLAVTVTLLKVDTTALTLPGNTQQSLMLYYKVSCYHSLEKLKLKAQILLYKLILDQENHKLLHAKYNAPPKQDVQVQCVHCQSSCTDYRGARNTRDIPSVPFPFLPLPV